MIAYGIHDTSSGALACRCLPALREHADPDALILTTSGTSTAAGYNEILAACRNLEGLEALILLSDDAELIDASIATTARRLIADGYDIVGDRGGSGGRSDNWAAWPTVVGFDTPPSRPAPVEPVPVEAVTEGCIVLSPRAIASMEFTPDQFSTGSAVFIDACFKAATKGLSIAVREFPVRIKPDRESTRSSRTEGPQSHPTLGSTWTRPLVARHIDSSGTQSPTSASATSNEGVAAGVKRAEEAPPGYYGGSRPEIVSLVPPTAQRILDVGCGSGALGHGIKQAYPNIEVSGIEYVDSAARRAKDLLDYVIQLDLNQQVDLPFPPGYFDVMIFGDVLEHLLRPQETLQQLAPFLAPDGILIASIPNVRHWSVLLPALVQDRWEYQDAGLLDKTHVHLFTLTEAVSLLANAEFRNIKNLTTVDIPYSDESSLAPLVEAASMLGGDPSEIRYGLTAYQYLIVAGRDTPGTRTSPRSARI